MAVCGECGTPLYHIDEACPNCLPGMADRPPTNPAVSANQKLRCELAEAESIIRGLMAKAYPDKAWERANAFLNRRR